MSTHIDLTWATTTTQYLLGFVFAFSGVTKALAWRTFLHAFSTRVPVLPAPLVGAFGSALIIVELVVAIGFLIGVWINDVVRLATALTAGMVLVIGYELANGQRMPCLCFGPNSLERVSGLTTLRLTGMLLLLLFLGTQRPLLALSPTATSIDAPVSALTALVLLKWVFRASDVRWLLAAADA